MNETNRTNGLFNHINKYIFLFLFLETYPEYIILDMRLSTMCLCVTLVVHPKLRNVVDRRILVNDSISKGRKTKKKDGLFLSKRGVKF